MADDGRCATEEVAAATDLISVDSRVPRERHKNRVDSCALGGWRCFSCSISSSTTTTTTTLLLPPPPPPPPQPQPQKSFRLTPLTSTPSFTLTAHRRRIIGDANDDDRRRDDARPCCWCAHCDGYRHNDNNENNEKCDVARSANVAVVARVEPVAARLVKVVGKHIDQVEGVKANGVVAAATNQAETTVVSRLEPAASEDRLRSGDNDTDVVVAAGILADDAASGVSSWNNRTRRGFNPTSIVAIRKYVKYRRSVQNTVNQVLDVSGGTAVSLVASGANGERNSVHENVDNETRSEKFKFYYDTHQEDEKECVYRGNEAERRRLKKSCSVLLVDLRCISNNNNNNNNNNHHHHHNSAGCGRGKGVSVRDNHSNDNARIFEINFRLERKRCEFFGSEEEKEDLVVVRLENKATAMQSETTTKTTLGKEEMAEREIDDGVVVARLGSPFKGQIRTAEDTLVGPCGKKRCADRYDSSESSDSGVAVSCGDCSSSGTSDITEPGSPCSTSSDEGVAIRVTAPSPLPSLLKLAPTTPPSHSGTRPQWPWTPPLAATACSTYKRLKGEPEAGTLPKAGAADPTARSGAAGGGKQQAASGKNHHHHHHESQGKITEYFKAQIKPQQSKLKKSSADMSLLVAKSSPEFRRPPTVQRNKGGLAKYLGVVLPNGRTSHEREGRTMTISPPLKKQSALAPRTASTKMEKKLCSKVLSGLPIPSDVLASIPSCKISSLRLTGEASPKPSGASPPVTPTASLLGEPMTIDFEDVSPAKPTVNENNNLTNGCANVRQVTAGPEHPLTRLSSGLFDIRDRKEEAATPRADEDDEDEEEEEDSTSGQSKAPSSPILSAPTTIRFPARAPEKKGPRGTDSGICRWDKCDGRFECSGALLEHLQAAHINTQQGGDNFVCHWQGCKVQGRTSCSRRWLERHVLSHGGNKPFRCIVDGCGSRFSSQPALERHVNSHFNQPETSSSSGRRSCESGGKLVRRNGKKLRYRRQPWSGKETPKPTMPARKKRKRNRVRTSMISVDTARLFDFIDTGVMEGLQHRLVELAKTRTQGRLAETPGNSMALTSQVLARRIELDGKAKVLLRWYPQDIAPDEWVLESEVQNTKHIGIRSAATTSIDEVSLVLYPAVNGGTPPQTRTKQRRKPVKNS